MTATDNFIEAARTQRPKCRSPIANFIPKHSPWVDYEQDEAPSTRDAELLCEGCPLKDLCYEMAVENGEEHGIWGGVRFDPKPRKRRRKNG